MKLKREFVLFFGASLLTSIVYGTGGSEAGNGGSSIVCQDTVGKITSVELLDFYEARTQRGIKVELGPVTDSVEQKLALVVQRVKRFDESRALELQEKFAEFAKNSRFFTGIRLVEIPDSDNLFIPVGCQQEQIAIWREPAVSEDRRYNVNRDLWDLLDNDNKAGLVLHEVLYYMARQNQGSDTISNSKMIRYMVSKLTSSATDSWSLPSYVDFLRKLNFKSLWYRGHSFVVDDFYPEFWVNDSLMGGPLADSSTVSVHGKEFKVRDLRFDASGELYQVTSERPVLLEVDSQSIWLQNDLPITIEKGFVIDGYAMPGNKNVFKRSGFYELKVAGSLRNKAVHLSFKRDGTLMFCNACEGSVKIAGQSVAVRVPDSYDDSKFTPASFYRWNQERSTSEGFSLFLAEPTFFQVLSDKVRFQGQVWGELKTGQISGGTFDGRTSLMVGNQRVSFAPSEVRFHSSGAIEYGVLAENISLKTVDGTNTLYLSGMKLWFDESGVVQTVLPTRYKEHM